MRDLRDVEAEAFRRCLDTPARASTLPPAAYTDAELYEREQRLVFRQGWVGVGRADRWTNTGDYATFEIGGVPVVVVRADNGLRAHANTCRHRASMIVSGEGNCTRMRCPFHAWTYSLDGRLVGAPDMHRTPGFDKEEHGLVPFRVEQRHGFVFVSVDPDPPSIDDWFAD
ncbi:MAG: Rieske (2Fe-2S) protein, partial [Acidimicrobiales bacterium]